MSDQESWDRWRAHVLNEIRRANETFSDLSKAVASLHVETAKLQVKSGVWGVLGGMIPVLILVVVEHLK